MSASVFPARAGMSPQTGAQTQQRQCVPRASGDEPELLEIGIAAKWCSPRERG